MKPLLILLLTLPAFAQDKEIDLDHWKLTLPVDAAGSFKGHPKEIAPRQLVDGFKGDFFSRDAKGSLVFWCPVGGATTEGTEYARSELREMLEPGNPRKNWGAAGTHVMEARCRVLQVPSNPKVVIGQIHSYTGKARPLVKLQYYKGRIEALVKRSPTKGKDKKLTLGKADLNQDLTYRIELKDGVLSLGVNGETHTENMLAHDPAWGEQTFYFKAGAYALDNKGDASEGARVSFSKLRVTHKHP